MQSPRNDGHDRELQAPEPLVNALRALHQHHVVVPGSVDAAILAAARQRLEQMPDRRILWLRPLVRWAAAAAFVVGALGAGLLLHRASGPSLAREDINRDGQVDILDALALALRVEQGEPLDLAWDLNADGRVDRADVDAIAARAVVLTRAFVPARADSSPRSLPGVGGVRLLVNHLRARDDWSTLVPLMTGTPRVWRSGVALDAPAPGGRVSPRASRFDRGHQPLRTLPQRRKPGLDRSLALAGDRHAPERLIAP